MRNASGRFAGDLRSVFLEGTYAMPMLSALIRTIRPARLFAALVLATLAHQAAAQTPVVSPDTLYFSWRAGGPTPTPRTLSITSGNGLAIAFTAITSGNGSWLTIETTSGFTPKQLGVMVDPTGLMPGTYTDIISIQAAGQLRIVTVRLLVSGSASGLFATPSVAMFHMAEQGAPPPAQIILVKNLAGTSIPFKITVEGGGSWLTVTPRNAQTTAAVELAVQPNMLPAGTYTAAVSIVDQIGLIAQTVHVTLLVGEDPLITVNPPALSFSALVGSSLPLSQNIVVSSPGGDTLSVLASTATFSGGDWLDVTPASGETNLVLVATVNAEHLPVGTYGGLVRVVALGRATTVSVSLTVTSTAPLTIAPRELSFTAGNGVLPAPRNVFVETSLGGPVTFTASTPASWIALTPTNGVTPEFVTVSADARGLPTGTYRELIEINATGSPIPQTVLATLTVTGVSELRASPVQVNLTAEVGSTEDVTQTVSITSTLGVLSWNAGLSPTPWLFVGAPSNITPGSVEISADPHGLDVGTHFGVVLINAPGAANSPLSIPVTLSITPPGPAISAVLHGASWTPGVFAPGTSVSITGAGLGPPEGAGAEIGLDGRVTRELLGVRVYFDEFPAALTYVRDDQINCMSPFGIAGRAHVDVIVEYEGVQSEPYQIQLVEAAPGIFTVNQTGGGPGAILNHADWMLNSSSNPAAAGDYVSVFATGAGLMDLAALDGEVVGENLPRPVLPVRAWIGDVEVEVTYAGGSPGLLFGILQVDLRIPPDLPSGTYSLVIRVGSLRSQTGVTISTN